MATSRAAHQWQDMDQVIQELRAAWMANPNQRLGQFLVNVANDVDLFYIEDADLIERMRTSWLPSTRNL
jgi:uncharacterized protein YihD (DUF1040 family)